MNITIVGGGNIGTQFAVHCSSVGHRVTIFTQRKNEFNEWLSIVDDNNKTICTGKVHLTTDEPERAFVGTDLIFVTVPAFMMSDIAKKILPYVYDGLKICLVPGTGGGECTFKEHIEQGCVLIGLQRVPSVARLMEYGKRVRCVGYRNELFVGAIPKEFTQECATLIANVFHKKVRALPNYLSLTLTPSNPILHTSRLRILFKDYRPDKYYERVPLFYEEWDDESSELLFKCDSEVQILCNKLSLFDLTYVKSLKEHYESKSIEELTSKIRSIKGFKGLKSPCIQQERGYLPDFSSRYFTADFPFGLSIIKQIMEFVGIECESVTATLEWYYKIAGKPLNEFQYSNYGIKSYDDFITFYNR